MRQLRGTGKMRKCWWPSCIPTWPGPGRRTAGHTTRLFGCFLVVAAHRGEHTLASIVPRAAVFSPDGIWWRLRLVAWQFKPRARAPGRRVLGWGDPEKLRYSQGEDIWVPEGFAQGGRACSPRAATLPGRRVFRTPLIRLAVRVAFGVHPALAVSLVAELAWQSTRLW
jgi:hypothetical protein